MSSFGGLSDKFDYQEFEFDSADATRSADSRYSITNWPSFYLGKPLDNVAAVKILEAQIPFTYYTINATNNTFLLSEAGAVSPNPPGPAFSFSNVTVTLTPGCYSAAALVTEIALQCTAVSAAQNVANPGRAFVYTTSTYNPTTFKFTFRSTPVAAAVSRNHTFTFNDTVSARLARMLGFDLSLGTSFVSNTPTGAGSSTVATVLNTTLVAQVLGASYAYICSRTLGPLIGLYLPGNGIVNPNQAGGDGPQMAKVPLTVNPGEITYWVDPDPEKWFHCGNSVFSGNIDFYVTIGTADYQTPIDFNGVPFGLKLGVLTNRVQHDDYLGGGKQNNRALARTWPTGGSAYQPF